MNNDELETKLQVIDSLIESVITTIPDKRGWRVEHLREDKLMLLNSIRSAWRASR